MPFLVQVFFAVCLAILQRSLMTPPEALNRDAAVDSNVDAPTISEGTAVAALFGSVLTGRQNVSWYGGLGASAISQEGVITGYKYSLTAQLSICLGPIEDIREVRFDDNVVPADKYTRTDTTDYWDYTINAPSLLGGDQQEGGIVGTMRVYKGTLTQTGDTEIATLVSAPLPGYRRVAYAVLRNMYMGTSRRLKTASFLVERLPNTLGLASNKHIIGSHRDSNIICVLHELLTNQVWGARIDPSLIDTTSWQAAGNTAYDEGLGVSLQLTTPQEVDAAVQNLLRYVDGTIYEDLVTGKIKIRLIREADLTGAPEFTAAQLSQVSITRVGSSDIRNTVKVTFTDSRRNYETGGVMARNSAATRALGGAVDMESVDLPGFTGPDPAMRMAEQLLRSDGYPLSKVEIVGDRSLASLEEGQPFKLVWTRPTINAYYRVVKVNTRPLDEGGVAVSAIEDSFSAGANTFTPPPSSGWETTATSPRPVSQSLLIETPYHLRRNDNRSLIYGAVAPNSQHTGFRALVNSDTSDTTLYDWMVRGVLTTSMAQYSGATLSTLTLAMTLPADVVTPSAAEYDAGEALLLIEDELLAYASVTRNGDGTVTFGTVARGVLDTVPRPHATGSSVYVLKTARVRANLDAITDAVQQVAAQTFTLTASQPIAQASVKRRETASRAERPAPPALPTVAGTAWGAGPHAYGPTVAWAPRTKLATQVLLQTETGETAEAGTTYRLRVYASDGTTLLETIDTSSTSAVPTSWGSLVLKLSSVLAGLESYQAHSIPVTIAAPLLLTEGSDNLATEANDHITLE